MPLTMTELAKLANVSQSAISLIINGKADGRISKKNQEKVFALIEKYNYRPNFAAKGLRNSKVYTIGIIMPAPVNSFYIRVIPMLQMKLAQKGYMALFSFWQDVEQLPDAYNSVLEHSVDGIITWDYHECLKRETIPAVVFNHNVKDFDRVIIDFDQAVGSALDYLQSLGHHKIGFLGLFRDARHISFRAYMKKLRLPLIQEWSRNIIGIQEEGARAMHALIVGTDLPTALITMNDAIAQGVIYTAYEAGIRVPENLSVLSFDNTTEAKYMIPPLTTIDTCPDKLTTLLTESILKRINNPSLPDREFIINSTLVYRKSCAPPNSDN